MTAALAYEDVILAGIGTTRVGDIPVLILRAEGEDRVIPVQVEKA